MVYSLDFKFVLGYNDRFSGCVDDSYRRYAFLISKNGLLLPEHS